jgi:hypothetical protein
VAVPALLFIVDWVSRKSTSAETQFLLIPPLAVIIFLIFSHPDGPHTAFRAVVVLPVIGAVIGEFCYSWLGLTPWGVATATLAVLVAQSILHRQMPPALAVCVLAMVLKAGGSSYAIGVALATLFCWCVFLMWRKFVWSGLLARENASFAADEGARDLQATEFRGA